jgi:hypothetical protein
MGFNFFGILGPIQGRGGGAVVFDLSRRGRKSVSSDKKKKNL